MNFRQVFPEKPLNTSEPALFPIEAGRVYRGIMALPQDPSVVAPAYKDAVLALALGVLTSYGAVPTWTLDQRPRDWPQNLVGPIDARYAVLYAVLYFELHAIRDGVLRGATPLGGMAVMHVVELWKEAATSVPTPAPGPAPSPISPPPSNTPAVAQKGGSGSLGWIWLGMGAAAAAGAIWWLRRGSPRALGAR